MRSWIVRAVGTLGKDMKRFRPAVWPLVGLVAVTLAILFLAPVVAQERTQVGPADRVQAAVTVMPNGSPLPAPTL